MNKKISLGVSLSITAIAIAITCIFTMTFSQDLFNSKVNVKERTELNEIDNYVRANFIGEINEEALKSAISNGYINGLDDKYAHYYSAEEFQEEKLSDAGLLVGLGFTVIKDEGGYIRLVKVEENSPASEAGFKKDDLIVAVSGEDVLSKGYSQSLASLKGEEGSLVNITIRREGVDSEYQLVRRKMEIVSVTGRVIDNIGYIKIDTFNTKTAEQFKKLIDDFTAQGVKGFVFDLRDNGGGILDACEEMLNYLLPAGDVATATYKDGSQKVIVKTDGVHEVNLPMSVIVNKNTASASELFAVALRDAQKAVLVGTNTYGKGVMQYTTELSDGSAIKITVATIETTKTPNYDGVGVKPNFEVTLTQAEEESFAQLDEKTDPQLKKAIEVIGAD